MTCPICAKVVPDDAPDFPFCTERCKLIDLGNWASEKYVIPASVQPEDEAEEGPDENGA
jgi:endogenous inhibitor of DNA gyrase (YacG/DUF329 family)